jgi:crotonobetainyl-CoA:carnitine CoA-transferase CaiB-like acyl-CoA transferase
MEGALSGVRIADLSRVLAGPYGTLILADLGAEVIKIEAVPSLRDEGGSALSHQRFYVPPREDTPITDDLCHFWSLNRNKKSIALDLSTKAGKEVFYDLVRHSDVVYDNFRPRVLESLGIDYETIKQINPAIISCSVSGFGESGPWRDYPAYDLILQAMSGGMSMTGMPGGPPCRAGLAIGDLVGGLFGAISVLAALQARQHTGKGQRVDISMLDGQISLLNYRTAQYFGAGKLLGPVGSGGSGAGQVPYRAFMTKDGSYVTVVAGQPRHWQNLCRALGLEQLLTDPRFAENAGRAKNEAALSAILEKTFLTKTGEEWETILLEASVPAGLVRRVDQALAHPQVLARDMVVSIDHPVGKRMKFSGNPVKMSGTPGETFNPAPDLGEHTIEVLKELLSYAPEKLRQLRERDIVWWPPDQEV